MADYFRAKIVAKRQITLPQLMLERLHLKEGDELEFTINDGRIEAVRPFRSIPMDYFPPEVLAMIERRTKEMEQGVDGGYWEKPIAASIGKEDAPAASYGHGQANTFAPQVAGSIRKAKSAAGYRREKEMAG